MVCAGVDDPAIQVPCRGLLDIVFRHCIKNDTDFDIFNWTTWVLLITFILALLASGSTTILHQRYKVIMLAMTTHKANGLSPLPILTYTRPTMTPNISSDAFAYVTIILSSILPSEFTLLVVTIFY